VELLEVVCDIGTYHYAAPPKPANCRQNWGDRIYMAQYASTASFECHSGSYIGSGFPTQDYDQPVISGPFSCAINEQAGVNCRNTSTHSSFQITQQSYQLG
jgi:hypothetical protein